MIQCNSMLKCKFGNGGEKVDKTCVWFFLFLNKPINNKCKICASYV
jgi:hypothetical protein